MRGSIGRIGIAVDWVLVFLAVCLIPLLSEYLLPRLTGWSGAVYLSRPLAWMLITLLVILLPRQKSAGKPRLRRVLIGITCGIALSQIYLMVFAGFLEGFGRSPYSFTAGGILSNLFNAASVLIGIELSRAWLINRLVRKPGFLIPILIALFYTLLVIIPEGRFPSLGSSLETWTEFFGATLLSVSMRQLLASFLAMWGGPLPALAYGGILDGFEWFSPYLPDLSWLMKALVGAAVPLVGLAVIQEYYARQCARRRRERLQAKGFVSTAICGVLLVAVVWFSAGVFPLRPLVIYSGSMRPAFDPGDIVIVAKKDAEQLSEGDIISYRRVESPVPVVHRLIKINKDKTLLAKGDDNDDPDDTIKPEQVRGKVVLVIPKAGWASVYIRKIFT